MDRDLTPLYNKSAYCQSQVDQLLMELEDELSDIIQIAKEGPQDKHRQLVRKICVVVSNEIVQRRMVRAIDDLKEENELL